MGLKNDGYKCETFNDILPLQTLNPFYAVLNYLMLNKEVFDGVIKAKRIRGKLSHCKPQKDPSPVLGVSYKCHSH